jgi:hypothetical protein
LFHTTQTNTRCRQMTVTDPGQGRFTFPMDPIPRHQETADNAVKGASFWASSVSAPISA